MEFAVSRDPCLPFHLLLPSLFQQTLPRPLEGRATTYHFWARNALFHGLGALGLESGDKILVPAFHCRTVVEPILQFGCEVVFYNVHRDGSVDFEDIDRKIDKQTRAILAIHYFGVLQPVHQLRAFCRQHALFFIEDCAHILMGEIDGEPIGSFGDVSIFSWRKFFPIYDGGLLVRNHVSGEPLHLKWRKLDGWFQVKIIKNLIEKSLGDKARQSKQVSWSRDGFPIKSENPEKPENNHNNQAKANTQIAEFDYSQVNWPMSLWSKAIIKKIDISSVVQKRKENSRILLNAINSMSDIQSWSPVDEQSVCAWAVPIVSSTRRDIHIKLREQGIQAFSWGGVIHPTLSLEQFPEAKFLYEHLVLLPNHQSLTRHELDFVIEKTRGIIERHLPHLPEMLQ